MEGSIGARELQRLAEAFGYPGAGYRQGLRELCAGCCEEARAPLARFLEEIEGYSEPALGEVYTRTFDLSPQSAPYLGVHLFGEDDSRRPRMMAALAKEYEDAGVSCDRELPDHLAVVLGALDKIRPELRADLIALGLYPTLLSMQKQLEAAGNPYQYLAAGAAVLVRNSQSAGEVSHA
jgi:nitrate reductase molybdenum cofactor assembly chaperone